MKLKEKKITKRFVMAITGAIFVLVAIVLTVLSLVLQNSEIVNDYSVAQDPIRDSDSAPESIFSEEESIEISENNVSDVFFEDDIPSDDIIEHGWVINEYGYTYIYGDSGYEQFTYTNFTLNRYADSINTFSEIVPDNTRYYNLLVPVSSTFASIPREIYIGDEFFNKSQSSFVSTISSKLNERVTNVPIVSILETKYDDGEYVYFRSDRNWTPLGAYYAYVSLCEALDFEPYSLNMFVENNIGDFLGSYHSATNAEVFSNNPDELICYSVLPEIEASLTVFDDGIVYSDYTLCGNYVYPNTAYNVFLGRAAERYEITSNSEGGSLLIVGDTSAHPMIPFLAAHYGHIDFISTEEFKGNIKEVLNKEKYDDVLTICYTTNAVTGGYIPAFINIGENDHE